MQIFVKTLYKMKEIARNIKTEREKQNLTQEYMASELDISQPAYSKIESAKTEVTFHQLIRISRILKIDILVLIREHSAHSFNTSPLEERVKKLENELKDLKRMLKANLANSM
jgi:transcriptional regulator with XRE-family HTH domain